MGKERRPERVDSERGYWRESRAFGLGLVSVLPLVVLYHCGIVQSSYPLRNLAEVWLTGPLQLVGLRAAHVLNVALLFSLIAVLWRSEVKASNVLLTVVVMIAEAALYGVALYKGGDYLTHLLHRQATEVFFAVNLDRAAPLLLALGAGVYEELLFRLLLVGGGTLLMQKVFLWDRRLAAALALAVSSLLFAAAHHVGSVGESFTTYNFLFRTVCGFLLGVIYVFRGFGIAAWTHALYNLLVVV
ncbi:MAG: CPBP family glutamic-type intramembrane protease [Candidatus Brocadiia bacterium]